MQPQHYLPPPVDACIATEALPLPIMWASPLETQHCASNSGRLHCSRSCTPVQRNAGDSLRAPGSKQLVRQPCLAQTTYPGASGYHPHFATFPPFGLSGSCGCNASTHMMREAPTPKGGLTLRLSTLGETHGISSTFACNGASTYLELPHDEGG